MKLWRSIVLLCVLPLLTGTAVYILFRARGIMGFSFAAGGRPATGLAAVLTGVLPDFCWAFSLASALYLYFRAVGWTLAQSTLVILPLLLLSEVIQIWLPRYFTFDWLDLGATLAAVLLSAGYFKNQRA